MNTCKVENCGSKRHAKDYCGKHYMRWETHGDTSKVLRDRYATPEESFAARTEWVDGCLVWTGTRTEAGYGQISVGKGVAEYTHRYAYEQANGPIPKGMFIDHKCHNRACCEDTHLRIVTNRENMQNPSGLRSHNTSGYSGVFLDKRNGRWKVEIKDGGVRHNGGKFPPYELHVAGYKAMLLRNEHFTYNDKEQELIP